MFLGGGPLAQTSHCPFLGPRVGAEPSGRLWSRPGGVSTAAPSPAAALPGPATRALVVGGPCVSPPLEAGGTGKRGPLLSGGLKRPPVGMVSRKGGGGEGPPGPRGQGRVWGLVGQALCVSRGDPPPPLALGMGGNAAILSVGLGLLSWRPGPRSRPGTRCWPSQPPGGGLAAHSPARPRPASAAHHLARVLCLSHQTEAGSPPHTSHVIAGGLGSPVRLGRASSGCTARGTEWPGSARAQP